MTTERRPTLADPPEAYARALDATRLFLAGIGQGRWEDPTPCTDWNVRELTNHMIYGTIWIEDIFAGRTVVEVGDKYDGDLVGDDALASYDAAAAFAKRSVAAPGAVDAVCHLRRGDTTGAEYMTSMFVDVFIHGWDLAIATGQGPTLDTDLVCECCELVIQREERYRQSSAFGEGRVADPGVGVGLQARLLAILGREG